MDSSNAPAISSTANQLFFKGSYLCQNWSLPDSIIYYLAKNPSSSKLYQKLIRSCKYFFSKNPIIVCPKLWFHVQEDISNIVIRKYGETNDIKDLILFNQLISFNELLFLASKANRIDLNYCTVIFQNGSIVSVEKIIEAFVQAKTFHIVFKDNYPSISSKTAENLIKIPHFSSINRISFSHISDAFDVDTFYDYMKKNKHTYFQLFFDDSISDAYRNRLEEIVDEIIETKNLNYKSPFVDFAGLNFEKCNKLYRISSML